MLLLLLLLFSQLSGGLSGSSGLWWSGNPQTRSGKDRSQATLRTGLWGSSQGWTGMSQREVNTGLFIRPHYYCFEHMSLTEFGISTWCLCYCDLLRLERVSRQRADQSTKEELRSIKAQYDSSAAEMKKVRELVKRLWHTYCICVKYS